MKRFKGVGPPFELTEEKTNEAIRTLFPRRPEILPQRRTAADPHLFVRGEMEGAINKMKTGTAPGPDGIPPEAVKELYRSAPQYLLDVMNTLLKEQSFPSQWRISTLVLIHKPGKPADAPNAYRPLCLENTLAKLYEHLIKNRLETEIDVKGELADNQFGFRKGKSTINAIKKVMQAGYQWRLHGQGERWCALATLDVKNAFNTASWNLILEELTKRGISDYLSNIVRDYFEGRCIRHKGRSLEITMGIPQGSVLGPLLWDIFYDPVLRLELMDGVETIGFADDLAIIVKAKDRDELIYRMNESLWIINQWMAKQRLELAPEKTEVVILSGKRDRTQVVFQLNGTQITPAKVVKYLGVNIGENMYFGPHVERVVKKA